MHHCTWLALGFLTSQGRDVDLWEIFLSPYRHPAGLKLQAFHGPRLSVFLNEHMVSLWLTLIFIFWSAFPTASTLVWFHFPLISAAISTDHPASQHLPFHIFFLMVMKVIYFMKVFNYVLI